ncbi:hypothetical protein LXA47_31380 [Massilia sp. P8910]|uniref:phage tail tube protein n=1 Tax=Massilia antarctica TaxID=2765360 RepID=UPI001E4BAED5|nr:hypothetical protein [Massilia antarctica]MCE3608074.1 hypothetical protein [Massilia antarctica]
MSNTYFDGQGALYIAPLGADGLPGGLEWVGDCEQFELDLTQKFDDIYESYTGKRSKAAHILTQSDAKIMIKMLNYSVENLARATQGSHSGAVSAGTVTDAAYRGFAGKSMALAHPNVSSVVITKGVTPLVLGTDYTLDAAKGLVTFLSASAVVTGSSANDLTVDYAFAANSGTVQGMTAGPRGYQLVFMGLNIADPSQGQVRVVVHKAILDLPKNLAWIDSKHASLDCSGEMLIDPTQPDGASQFFTVTMQN